MFVVGRTLWEAAASCVQSRRLLGVDGGWEGGAWLRRDQNFICSKVFMSYKTGGWQQWCILKAAFKVLNCTPDVLKTISWTKFVAIGSAYRLNSKYKQELWVVASLAIHFSVTASVNEMFMISCWTYPAIMKCYPYWLVNFDMDKPRICKCVKRDSF